MNYMNDFYKINSREVDGEATLFDVSLLSGCRVYSGHFPGNPISPGVCSMQMIKECAEQVTGRRLFLAYIIRCRFSSMITPTMTPRLWLRMHLSKDGICFPADSVHGSTSGLKQRSFEQHINLAEMYNIKATLFDDITTYIEFKGEFARKMENGECKMQNAKWRMQNGKC